jgi:hypothetical protein
MRLKDVLDLLVAGATREEILGDLPKSRTARRGQLTSLGEPCQRKRRET